jgi:hypothetical protein
VKEWKKISQANGSWKQARVAILISDKAEFRCRLVRKDNDGHCVLIKGTIH